MHPSIVQATELRGKKVGVGLIGDSEDRFITLFIERAGLSAKDVTKISLGTNISDKLLGLKSGSVSAAVFDPAGTVAAQREGLRKLAYLGDMFALPFQGYLTTNQKLSENPAQTKRWIRAMVRSLLFVRERPDEATDVAMRRLRIRNISKAMLTEAIRNYVRAFPQGIPGTPSADGVRNILEHELRIPMKIDRPLAPERFFDLRLVEEVRREFEDKSVRQ